MQRRFYFFHACKAKSIEESSHLANAIYFSRSNVVTTIMLNNKSHECTQTANIFFTKMPLKERCHYLTFLARSPRAPIGAFVKVKMLQKNTCARGSVVKFDWRHAQTRFLFSTHACKK